MGRQVAQGHEVPLPGGSEGGGHKGRPPGIGFRDAGVEEVEPTFGQLPD